MFQLNRRDAASEIDFEVTVKDYAKFKNELKAFSPELRREMDREIRSNLTPIATLAKSLVPVSVMRNWRKADNAFSEKGWGSRLAWDQSEVKKGITVKQGGRRARGKATQSAWRITNSTGAGVVYELAGSKTDGDATFGGRQFVTNIRNVGGLKTSRLIWRAWDESKGEEQITKDIKAIVEKYETILQASANK
jgi:hypothetical protein